MLKRAFNLFAEYTLCATGMFGLWVIIASAVSFIAWEPLFTTTPSLNVLRLMILIGLAIATFRSFFLIKNNKI